MKMRKVKLGIIPLVRHRHEHRHKVVIIKKHARGVEGSSISQRGVFVLLEF